MDQWLKKRVPTSLTPWLESIILSLLALTLGFAFNPSDPFFQHGPFPWPWLAPLLLALRYSMGPALLSLLIITATFVSFHVGIHDEVGHARLYLLGGFISTILCAEFSTLWQDKVRKAELQNQYTEDVLSELSNEYFVVRLSHDHLEQRFINKPITLRQAMRELRQLLAKEGNKLNYVVANRLLYLLAHHGSLQHASLFTTNQGELDLTAIASIGAPIELDCHDPIIENCLTTGKSSFIMMEDLEELIQSEYLAAIPLQTSQQPLMGLLVIKEMPFLALNKQTLQVLSILLNYFSNDIWSGNQAMNLIEKYPDCPYVLATEVYKLSELYKSDNIKSILVSLYLHDVTFKDDILLQLQSQHRGLDYVWRIDGDSTSMLMTLMPFSNEHAVAGYTNRIHNWLKENYGIGLGSSQAFIHYRVLNEQDPRLAIEQLMEWHHDYR